MKRTAVQAVRLCIVGVACLSLSGPCGQSQRELTLQQYLQRLNQIGVDGQYREDQLKSPFEPPFATDDPKVDAAREYVRDMRHNLEVEDSELRRLSPPPIVQPAHQSFVNAHASLLNLWIELESKTNALSSASQFRTVLFRFFDSTELASSSTNLDDACQRLQRLGDEHRAGVDLECQN